MPQRPGAITLIATFFTAMVALMLLLTVNIHAVDEKQRTHDNTISEQAFYAAQSCTDEAYLHLRTDVSFRDVATLNIGSGTCTAHITPSGPDSGQIVSTGRSGSAIRTIQSSYSGAGATVAQNNTQIYHVIDRSGSMDDQVCTVPTYTSQYDCEAVHHMQWVTKASAAKDAAKYFNTTVLVPGNTHDSIGLISYASEATWDSALQTDASVINNDIDNMPSPLNSTNFDDAIALAVQHLPVTPTPVTRAMILLTDGQPTTYHTGRSCVVNGLTMSNDDCSKYWGQQEAQAAKDAGILVFTIGFGNITEIDIPYMESISSVINGHTLFFAPTSTGLNDVYKKISDILIQYNLQQGSWNEQ